MLRRFWDRYKLTIVLEAMPGDLLQSRIFRETQKRFLKITELLKIKGVKWERRNHKTEKQVGENLYTKPEAADADDSSMSETITS